MNVPLTKDERTSDDVVYVKNSLLLGGRKNSIESNKSNVRESNKSSISIESNKSISIESNKSSLMESNNGSIIESSKSSIIETSKKSVIEGMTLSMYNGRRQDSVLDTSVIDVKRINDVILWDLIYEDREIMIFFKIIGFHWYH